MIMRSPLFIHSFHCFFAFAILTLFSQNIALAQPEFKRLSAKERIAIGEREEVEAATDVTFQNKMEEGHELFKERHYLKAIHSYEEAQEKRPYNVYPRVIIADIELSMKDTLALLREEEKKSPPPPPKEIEAKTETEPKVTPDDTVKRLDDWERKERERMQKERDAKTKSEPIPAPIDGDVPRMSIEEYRTELGQKFPDGITETISVEGNKNVTQRVVVRSGKGDEYRRVEHSWGGVFYFKNGEAVPERVWKQETEK